MMGSGKSTVGAVVAERLGVPFDDTDRMVEDATAMSIASLWAIDDGATFRLAEAAAVAAVASMPGPRVAAAGGGAVLAPDSIDHMQCSGVVVWLEADPSDLAARVTGQGGRPLLEGEGSGPGDRLGVILAERHERYEAAAHHRVATGGRSVDEVGQDVARLWSAAT